MPLTPNHATGVPMSRLFLRFNSSPAETHLPVEWLVRDDAGSVVQEGSATLDQLGAAGELAPWADDSRRVVVFLPVAEMLALGCAIPGRNAAQMRRAAPYAVEEFIAEDIDTMHVACASVARNERLRCLVAPRDTVQAYLDALASAGLAAGTLTADAMALPLRPSTVTVLHEGQGTALLRTIDQAACVDEPNLGPTLAAIRDGLDGDEEPKLLRVNRAASTQAQHELPFLPTLVEEQPIDGSLLSYLADSFDEGNAINLLQGEFAVKRRTSGAWSRWRPVAAAAGGWLAIALVLLAAQSFWADWQASALRDEAEQLYKDIYQVQRVPGNPATRMRFRLGQAPVETTDFHHLIANLGLSLQDIAGNYELESLTYNERNGLGADVILPGYEALEALQQALAGRGLALDVASAEQQNERIRANLRLVAGRAE